MQVTTQQIDPCKVEMTITVEPDQVKVAQEKAFSQFARSLQLPGFRKGKVPPHMAKSYVDEGRVKQRAAEILVEPAYRDALEETKTEPFAQPELDIVEMNDDGPFVFKALVPLRPQVTLGPYKAIALEKHRRQIADEDVDRQIEEMRLRQAKYDDITDRAVMTGDVVMADLVAQIEGQDEEPNAEAPSAEARPVVVEVGKNIPDFDNGLVGMTIGETKTIEALYPDDFTEPTMQGKRATFTVTAKEIRQRQLPELNDEFAQAAQENVQSVEELRAKIRENLEKEATETAERDLEERLIRQIVQNSEIHFPDVLLRMEMQDEARQLQEQLQEQNLSVERWLEMIGKSREEVEAQMAAGAGTRIRNSLVLSEVARAEEIAVDDADVEAQIAERAERAKVSAAAVRAYLEKNNQLAGLRDQALTEKILAFLKNTAQVTEKVVTQQELQALQEPAADLTADDSPAEQPEAAAAAAVPVMEKSPARRRRGGGGSAEESSAVEENPAAQDT